MPALSGTALALALLGAPASACPVEVLAVSATYEEPADPAQGARILVDLDVRSSSTVALGRLELALFLGARLGEVDRAHVSSLPTQRSRRLDGGGIAFRAVLDEPLPPRGRRRVRLDRPLEPADAHERGRVAARVGRCVPAEGPSEARVPASPQDGEGARAFAPGALLGLGAMSVAFAAWRRRRRVTPEDEG